MTSSSYLYVYKHEHFTNMNSRGIRRFERPQQTGKPYCVQWRVDGHAKTESYPTEEARDARALELQAARRQGSLIRQMTRLQQDEFFAIKASIGEVSWQIGRASCRER